MPLKNPRKEAKADLKALSVFLESLIISKTNAPISGPRITPGIPKKIIPTRSPAVEHENLNNENLSGVKEEIAVIKEWADKQVSEMENQQNINNPDSTQDNSNKDGTLANTPLPQAGSMTGIILVVLAVTIIGTIITAIQYRKIK